MTETKNLSALSELRGSTLWAYYNLNENDFSRQLQLAKTRHEVKAGDPICCIVRPLSMSWVDDARPWDRGGLSLMGPIP